MQDLLNEVLRNDHVGKGSLTRYAIAKRDIQLLKFLLQCKKDTSKDTESKRSKDSVHNDFLFAVERGDIDMIALLVSMMGVELPLDSFVKESGADEAEKPKYYQGLSINGRKMKKWAQKRADNDKYNTLDNDDTPPLLEAIRAGGLAATEWFLSDTPLRLYKEFGADNSNDPRLKTLAKAQGGFDQAVGAWLGRRSA